MIYDAPTARARGGRRHRDGRRAGRLPRRRAGRDDEQDRRAGDGTLGRHVHWHKQGWFHGRCQRPEPDIEFLYRQTGPDAYSDAPGARAPPTGHRARGADIVLGKGDGASFGMIQAVETATPPPGADGVWFIDVIGDKSDRSVDPNGVLLSSIMWNFTDTFEQAIAQIDAGTFGTTGHTSMTRTAVSGCSRPTTSPPMRGRRSRPHSPASAMAPSWYR